LNRNFEFKFGLDATDEEKNPCNDTYQGKKAFSEKETSVIRDLIMKNNVFIWMHFDGLQDQIVIPWTYSSSLKDFGSEYLNQSYEELKTLGVKVGNSESLGLGSFGGSFVDYGASLGVYSMQLGIESSVVDGSEILKSCKKYYENVVKIFNASLKALEILEGSWNVSEGENLEGESSVVVEVVFVARNPSKLNHSVDLFMEYNSTTANLTVEEVDSSEVNQDQNSSRSRSLSSSNYSFDLKELSSKTIKTTLLLKGEAGFFSLNLNLQLILSGSSDSNSYSLLSSKIMTIENITGFLPSSEDSGSSGLVSCNFLSCRSWYRSAGHHEGVAVGLVTFFISLFLILSILYLIKLYKTFPSEDDEEEYSSEYVKREVKTLKSPENHSPEAKTPEKSFEQRPAFKAESSPLRTGKISEPIKTVSIPINTQKFAIDDDEKRSASPVINVPNRSKVPVKSPDPEIIKRPGSPKGNYSTPSFPKEEIPTSSGPQIKKNDLPETNLRPLAPMDYGSAPEFNVKNEVRQPTGFNLNKEEPRLPPSSLAKEETPRNENKRPSGPVVLKDSGSEDDIEILHAPNVSIFGASGFPPVYKPHTEKSDDGEFEIMPVSESKTVKDSFTPTGSNQRKPGPPMSHPSLFTGIPSVPIVKAKKSSSSKSSDSSPSSSSSNS
jgi:hypothetical protein